MIHIVNSSENFDDLVKAGVAKIDITPPMEIRPTLGGYSVRMGKPATGIHDPIYAKALCISNGTKCFVLVTADVLAFPSGVKSIVMKSLADSGWGDGEIMFLPSHSHTSIGMAALNPRNNLRIFQKGSFHKELFDLTIERLTQVITESSRKMLPVSTGTSVIQLSGWNQNRRTGNTTCDNELTVTRIDTKTGNPLAVLVNWTAHPTLMGPEDMMFSGGWPGHLQRKIEAFIGQNITTMYYNGAQGDQSPVLPGNFDSSWQMAESYGLKLGEIVWQEWQKIIPVPLTRFSYHLEKIDLPECLVHPGFMQSGNFRYGFKRILIQRIAKKLLPSQTHSISARIGDLAIVGIPGEMIAQLGLLIKSQTRKAVGLQNVTIGGLADEWIGYILSTDEYRKGDYEATISFYGESLGNIIAESVVRGASLLKKIPYLSELK
ncbi:hypothetical protein GF312_08425 [Candidatus Poribacteria bacterium]|nr:hypothetical protein [Candidatus Poribacteria bacterium]